MQPGIMCRRVEYAVSQIPQDDRDAGVVQLALGYAEAIDDTPEMIVHLGPKLLAALESLLLTPRARATVVRGTSDQPSIQRSPLDELRARRENRAAAAG